mgnify:CR=1 FL=1
MLAHRDGCGVQSRLRCCIAGLTSERWISAVRSWLHTGAPLRHISPRTGPIPACRSQVASYRVRQRVPACVHTGTPWMFRGSGQTFSSLPPLDVCLFSSVRWLRHTSRQSLSDNVWCRINGLFLFGCRHRGVPGGIAPMPFCSIYGCRVLSM